MHLCHQKGFSDGTSGPSSAGDIRDVDSIPWSGRSLGEGHDNLLQYLAWRILWTEEPGRLQSIGLQRIGHN